MIKKILVGICRSPAQATIMPIVEALASRHSAEVTGMALLDAESLAPTRPPSTGVFPSKIKERQETLDQAMHDTQGPMRSMRDCISRSGQSFIERQVGGGFELSLGNLWSFQDLLVMANAPWFAGEANPRGAVTLLRSLANGIRPIVAVPPYASAERKKALVALSGSLESAKAMKHFVQLGPWPDIPLHIVTVGSPKNAVSAEQLLSDAAEYATAHGFSASTAVLADEKDRTQVILREAAAVGADTLVIGSSYSRFLLREKFGSHVQQLLAKFEGVVFLSH